MGKGIECSRTLYCFVLRLRVASQVAKVEPVTVDLEQAAGSTTGCCKKKDSLYSSFGTMSLFRYSRGSGEVIVVHFAVDESHVAAGEVDRVTHSLK